MAFFPRNFYAPETAFTPLFQLLNNVDSQSQVQCQNGRRAVRKCRAYSPQWHPKFDIREVADAYELYGELAGLNKDDIQLEFTEAQTLAVRGKTERSYNFSTEQEDATMVEPTTPTTTASHQATVEDEQDAEDQESGFETIENPNEKPVEKPVVEEKQQQEQQQQQQQPQPAVDNAKYWLTERQVGEFTRTFHFPSRIDQDNVTASFKDGILSINVPKAKKLEARRITVF